MTKLLEALHFAAQRHVHQRRKGLGAEPYVNHLIEVATLLATLARVEETDLLVAAVLHDVVEDTETTLEEIEQRFGVRVRDWVAAVSDDKSLPRQERKRLQIEHMRGAPLAVKLLKLADHCSNIAELPQTWTHARRSEFAGWSARVVAECRGVNAELEAEYDGRLSTTLSALVADTN